MNDGYVFTPQGQKEVFATVWTRFHPINDEQEATSNE